MPTLCWMTDLHLDAAEDAVRERFYQRVEAAGADALLITGDIADGRRTEEYLVEMAERVNRPVYFVLGNHDFYGGSIRDTRHRTAELADRDARLGYLTTLGVVELSPTWGLVGHDGWPDARLGDFENSQVFLPDFVTIEDLDAVRHDRPAMQRRMAELGDEAAACVGRVLPEALDRFPQVVLATHVPPLAGTAWYRGHSCDEDWLPYFACRAMGDVLLGVMRAHPDRRLLVLCGHTHGGGEVRVLDNLHVITGGASSGSPAIQQVLEFDGPGVQTGGVSW